MGTWGTGIYENDSTQDYIAGVINYLSDVVRNIVKWDTLLHPGMAQSEIMICHIDLLNAICSRGNLYIYLPDSVEIKKWQDKYMEIWEFCIDECNPTEEYKTERGRILKKSFNDLIALSGKNDNKQPL